MAGSLIVPLDGSKLAEDALTMATAHCSRTDAAMHLVHVRRIVASDRSDRELRLSKQARRCPRLRSR